MSISCKPTPLSVLKVQNVPNFDHILTQIESKFRTFWTFRMDCGVCLQDINMRFFRAGQKFYRENIIFYFLTTFGKKCVSEIQKSAFSEKSAIFKISNLIFKIFWKKFEKKFWTFLFFCRIDNPPGFLEWVRFWKFIENFRSSVISCENSHILIMSDLGLLW